MTGRNSFLTACLAGAAPLGLAGLCVCQGPDRPKAAIERPAKDLVARTAGPAVPGAIVNPKVQPGKVRWHASFDDACRAARASGKPVLLFEMMGRLDEKFC
jgi:hypothetical protein